VEPGRPGNVAGLLAGLGDAAAGHLLDAAGLHAGPFQQRGLRGAEELGGMQAGPHAAALADGGPHRLHDDRSSHRSTAHPAGGQAERLRSGWLNGIKRLPVSYR
jgi:hypothetical protein